jgi:hypothetical protein
MICWLPFMRKNSSRSRRVLTLNLLKMHTFKAKAVPLHAGKAPGAQGRYSYYSLALDGVSGQPHAPAAL